MINIYIVPNQLYYFCKVGVTSLTNIHPLHIFLTNFHQDQVTANAANAPPGNPIFVFVEEASAKFAGGGYNKGADASRLLIELQIHHSP